MESGKQNTVGSRQYPVRFTLHAPRFTLSAFRSPLHALRSTLSAPTLLFSAVFVLVFALYWLTLAPGVVGGDAGEHQFTGPLLGIPHATGYPLYVLLSKVWTLLIPLGTPAWRMNLLSAVGGTLAAATTALVVYRLTQPAATTADPSASLRTGRRPPTADRRPFGFAQDRPPTGDPSASPSTSLRTDQRPGTGDRGSFGFSFDFAQDRPGTAGQGPIANDPYPAKHEQSKIDHAAPHFAASLASRSLLYASHFTLHASRFSLPALRSSLLAPRSSLPRSPASSLLRFFASSPPLPTASWAAGLTAGLVLAFGLTLWQWSIMAGVRSINILFFALLTLEAIVWQQQRRRGDQPAAERTLRWLALTVGLSLAHHRTTIFYLPSLAGWLWWHDHQLIWQPKRMLRLFLLVVAPLSLYLFIYFRGINNPPYSHEEITDWQSFWFLVGAGDSAGLFFSINPAFLPARLAFIWGDLLVQLSLPGVLLAGLGGLLLLWRQTRHFIFQGLLVLLLLLFTLDFEVVNLNEAPTWYLMPAYFILAVWLGVGVYGLWEAGYGLMRRGGGEARRRGGGGAGEQGSRGGGEVRRSGGAAERRSGGGGEVQGSRGGGEVQESGGAEEQGSRRVGERESEGVREFEFEHASRFTLHASRFTLHALRSFGLALPLAILAYSLAWPNWQQIYRDSTGPLDEWRQRLRGTQAQRLVESSLPYLEPGSLILGDWEQYPPFVYYQLINGVRPDLVPRLPLDRWPEQVAAARAAGQPVYFARKTADLIGTPYLSMAGPLVHLQTAPRFEAPGDIIPLQANFEGELELIGYRAEVISQEATPGGAWAGPIIQLLFYWRAPHKVKWDYALSLRLLDPAGQIVYQRDATHPVLSSYPTSLWTPAEVVGDFYELPFPPGHGPLSLHLLPYRTEGPNQWHNLVLNGMQPPQEGILLGPFEAR